MILSCFDCTGLYHFGATTTFPMEPIVTALCNEVSKSIRLTHFVKELPHKIRRFAYCCNLGSTAACITVSHSGTSRCDCDNTVRHSTVRNSMGYRSAIPSHLTEGRAECAKHTKATNCVRGFVISLRTQTLTLCKCHFSWSCSLLHARRTLLIYFL